jgi:hypothetical protein
MVLEQILSNVIVQAVLMAVARSLAGWLENALQNGKIEKFELKLLGATTLRIVIQTLGLTGAGAPVALAFLTDFVITKFANALKEKKATELV